MEKKSIIIAGVTSLMVMATIAFVVSKKRKNKKDQIPPANAPQTPVQNPGDQSDFPAAATGDKDLG